MPIALMIAVALPFLTATAGAPLAPQWPLSEKNLRPQLTVVSVMPTTWFSAAVTWLHFELAPQLLVHVPSAESFIEPDLSWTIRMSGGKRVAPDMTAAQLASGLDMPEPPVPVPPPPKPPRPVWPPLPSGVPRGLPPVSLGL